MNEITISLVSVCLCFGGRVGRSTNSAWRNIMLHGMSVGWGGVGCVCVKVGPPHMHQLDELSKPPGAGGSSDTLPSGLH